MEPHERLKQAREARGYRSAAAAAEAMGVETPTYAGHENGSRGLSRVAARYAEFFHVSLDWLLRGRGPMVTSKRGGFAEPQAPYSTGRKTAPLVGFVGAGAEAHFFPQDSGSLDEVPAPDNASEDTVAVEIRGESLGSFFNRWLVYYDDVRRPVTSDLVGKLCVVGLDDGRILIKKIQRSKSRGLFHLLSQTEDPILDVRIDWAAKVQIMMPR